MGNISFLSLLCHTGGHWHQHCFSLLHTSSGYISCTGLCIISWDNHPDDVCIVAALTLPSWPVITFSLARFQKACGKPSSWHYHNIANRYGVCDLVLWLMYLWMSRVQGDTFLSILYMYFRALPSCFTRSLNRVRIAVTANWILSCLVCLDYQMMREMWHLITQQPSTSATGSTIPWLTWSLMMVYVAYWWRRSGVCLKCCSKPLSWLLLSRKLSGSVLCCSLQLTLY